MPRGSNAQIAADLFTDLRVKHGWDVENCWKGVALLLLTCEIQKEKRWAPFLPIGATAPLDAIVFRESNDFEFSTSGKPNGCVERARQLSAYLSAQLNCDRGALCGTVGKYWRVGAVAQLQFHNLVGHAFRSIMVEILRYYGAAGLTYEEEYDAQALFSGWPLKSRSKKPKIDILVLKGQKPVAMISTRWRYRHDRVDFIDEAHSYSAAAARLYGHCPYFALTGEFSPSRLAKVLENSPHPIAAAVHFCPALITEGLGANGRTTELKGLPYLVNLTHGW